MLSCKACYQPQQRRYSSPDRLMWSLCSRRLPVSAAASKHLRTNNVRRLFAITRAAPPAQPAANSDWIIADGNHKRHRNVGPSLDSVDCDVEHQDVSTNYLTEVYISIVVVGTATTGATVQIQVSPDAGTTYYSPPTLLVTAGLAAGTYNWTILVPTTAGKFKTVFTQQSGGTSSTCVIQSNNVTRSVLMSLWTGWESKPPQGTPLDPTHPLAPPFAWVMNEGSGLTVYNIASGGATNNGVLTASPTWANGINGPAINTAVGNSSYIDCGTPGRHGRNFSVFVSRRRI